MTDEFTGPGTPLTDGDLVDAADYLGVELAAVKAVAEVESAGDGFLPDGRPKILFESYQFHRGTGGVYSGSHPEISKPRWTRDYLGGAREYDRLERAMALDRRAALLSASWGRFQILGSNYAACGFEDVEGFVRAHVESEARHLEAFVGFIRSQGLTEYLRVKDWAGFARRYNGPGYAQNRYDEKMAAAYARWAA